MADAANSQVTIIFAIGTTGMLLMAGAIVLFVILYQKRLLEEKLKRLDLEAEYQQKMLRAALESQESERIRVAKDLHDDVGMMLMTMRASLNAVSDKNVNDDIFTDIRSLVDDTHETVRRISWDLMPSTLERFGLVQTVREMCDRLSAYGGTPVEFHEVNTSLSLDKNQDTLLYRIIQESVTNALRHARAKKIEVILLWETGFLEVQIKDDGVGFDFPEEIDKVKGRHGLGLINIESRTNVLGATLAYERNEPTGTIVRIKLKTGHG